MLAHLQTLLILLPLLASAQRHAHANPRGPAAAHPHLDSRTPQPPLDIFNNVLITERSSPAPAVAEKRHPHSSNNNIIARQIGGGLPGQKLVRRVKKRACKAPVPAQNPVAVPSVSTSMIGNGAFATGASVASSASNAQVTPAPSASSTPTDESWSYWTSAYSSASAAAAEQSSSSATSSAAAEASSSSSSSSAAPAQSSSSGSGGGESGKSAMLFPVGRGTASWTTNSEESGAMSKGNAPDGSSALVANFPAGTVKLASGQGFSFYSEGSKSGVYAPGAKEVVFSYSAFFEDGFQFARGGKMPGLFGGTSFETAKSCSGGKQDGREECFSARLMWRSDGMGEAYNYYPTSVEQGNGYCQVGPKSVCDANFGDSIGRGSFYWSSGQWTTVAQRLRLNDVGQSNGEQEVFVNGKSVLKLTGLQISVNADTKIYGIMAQTFFGGSDSSWASPRDQNIWFKDFSMAVIA